MRAMKFRAWHKPSSAMMMVHTLHWNGNGECIGGYCHDDEWNEIAFDVTHTIIMQFTGLKDRNGEDVWEGDIVHFSYGIPPIGVNAPIEFLNGSFYAITDGHKPSKAILGELNDYVGDFEIYGNVYENPGLIGGTQKEAK